MNLDNLVGTNFNDAIIGVSARNVLNGGLGNDAMTSGSGADFFVFDSLVGASNIDTISDVSAADDKIRLENTGVGLFNSVTATGTIAANAFWTGIAAHLATERIIYNSLNGDRFYDDDGTGATAAIKLGVLGTGLTLPNADFVVI